MEPVSVEGMVHVDTNMPLERLLDNVRHNSTKRVPWIKEEPPHDKVAILVGGGPSLADCVEEIRARQKAGQVVFAQNGAARFLRDAEVTPDYQVIVDGRPETAALVCKTARAHLICSQCDSDLIDDVRVICGVKNLRMFHPYMPGVEDNIHNPMHQKYSLIVGGTTVGIVNMALAHCMGYRTMHLFGYDSSIRKSGTHHAYRQSRTKQESEEMHVECGGKKFLTTPTLVSQVQGFQLMVGMLRDCEIYVHGDGLLPTVARMMVTPAADAAGKPLELSYDLGTHPATWDFVSWLFNADVYRRERGYGPLKIKFGGKFRSEVSGLTDDQKQQMLDCVCRPAITMIGATEGGDGSEEVVLAYTFRPTVDAFRSGQPLPELKPSDEATAWAERYRGAHVITLRESEYWPLRNSDIGEWLQFSDTLPSGERVIFVRDTSKAYDPLLGYETCPEASLDMDKRLALYRAARMNYFVANGPAALALYSRDIPYVCFVKSPTGYRVNSDEWLRQFTGVGRGEQWPWATDGQRMVWQEDTLGNIVRAAATVMAVCGATAKYPARRKTA